MLSRVASWHHGSAVAPILTPTRSRSSSRPCCVIFGNSRSNFLAFSCPVVSISLSSLQSVGDGVGGAGHRGRLALAQHLPVDLAGGRLGQLTHERDVPRILVCAQTSAHQLLDLADERVVTGPPGDDERLHDLAAERV